MNFITNLYKTLKNPTTIFQCFISASLVAAFLLLVPLFAEMFLEGMDWGLFDFVAAWILLFGAGFTYRLIARKVNNINYKAATGVAVTTALFLVWSNLAVGLIGSEDNAANWMFVGVLALGLLGAIITRFQSKGMSKVLFSMALAHLLISIVALLAGLHLIPQSSIGKILGVNGFFAFLWIASGLLYRNAAKVQ